MKRNAASAPCSSGGIRPPRVRRREGPEDARLQHAALGRQAQRSTPAVGRPDKAAILLVTQAEPEGQDALAEFRFRLMRQASETSAI